MSIFKKRQKVKYVDLTAHPVKQNGEMETSPRTYTILIDMDDTIERLGDAWTSWLNNKYDLDVSWGNIDSWDICSFYPSLSKDEVFRPLFNEEFWKTVKPMQDAQKYVKRLIDDGHDVYIVTASHFDTVSYKMNSVLSNYFPFIDMKKVIVVDDKSMIRGDIIVDDGVHNVERFDGVKILFSAPHNANYNAELNKIHRANNWEEVYEMISSPDISTHRWRN